jgi:hypothetical protein
MIIVSRPLPVKIFAVCIHFFIDMWWWIGDKFRSWMILLFFWLIAHSYILYSVQRVSKKLLHWFKNDEFLLWTIDAKIILKWDTML